MDQDLPAVSRRERPAKPAITRQGIIDIALDILREEGLDKVTMRRIAAVLDTGPASLYVYVRNTEDLHAQILDVLLEPVGRFAPSGGPWRERLKTLLINYGAVLFAYPEMARMALSTHPSGPNSLALVDTVLGLLAEGGVSGQTAAWGVDLLLLYPTAIAVEHSAPATVSARSKGFASLVGAIAAADGARHPHIAALRDALTSDDSAGRVDWAFDVLLDGIVASSMRMTAERDEA